MSFVGSISRGTSVRVFGGFGLGLESGTLLDVEDAEAWCMGRDTRTRG